jgi:hypothetical protein
MTWETRSKPGDSDRVGFKNYALIATSITWFLDIGANHNVTPDFKSN